MPSIEISNNQFAARITYDLTQDVGLNRSVMTVTSLEMRATVENFVTQSCYVVGYVNVNGSTAVKTGSANTGIMMSRSYSTVNGDVQKYSVTVNHQADGSGPISVYVRLTVYTNYGSAELGWISQTDAAQLPRIPRVSTLTAAGVELGQTMTIAINRAASGFTDTVSWRCGNQSGTLAAQTAATQLSWTPPMELANQAPEATGVTVVLTVVSYWNGTQIGSREASVWCGIPASVVPTLTVTVSDRMGYLSKYGGYVQNQSQARVVTQAAGAYGSSIRNIQVSCGQLTGTGADVSFSLGQSGSVAIRVTVTDSRGRTASGETAITVLPYQRPRATVVEAFRCDETGAPQPDGQWLKVVFDGSVTALTGNSAAYRGLCTVHNGTDTRTVLLSDYTNQQTVTRGYFLLTAGIDTAYDCRVSVQDDFYTETAVAMVVSVAFALMDFCRDTKAVGIGMRAREAQKLSIGLDTDMHEHAIRNLADPQGAKDAANRDYVDRPISYAWVAGNAYAAGDYCIHNGFLWRCATANTGVEPGTNGTYWHEYRVTNRLTILDGLLSGGNVALHGVIQSKTVRTQASAVTFQFTINTGIPMIFLAMSNNGWGDLYFVTEGGVSQILNNSSYTEPTFDYSTKVLTVPLGSWSRATILSLDGTPITQTA